MPRDYAKQKTKKTTSKKRGGTKRAAKSKQKRMIPGWFWLATGLVVGLFIAGLVYLKEYKGVLNPTHQAKKKTIKQHAKKNTVKQPKFDFYKILPEMSVAVPEQENQLKQSTKAANKNNLYVLQVASFKRFKDADQLKAKLTLEGFDVKINDMKSKGTLWHRVWIGPFDNLAQVEKNQKELHKHKIKAILLKVES